MDKVKEAYLVREKVTDEYRNAFLKFLEVVRNKIRISDLEEVSMIYAAEAKKSATAPVDSKDKP